MIVRSISVQEPDPKCEDCGEAIEELVSSIQTYAANGRDCVQTTYCKTCGSRIVGQTRIEHKIDPSVMPVDKRTDEEKRTGMRGRTLEKGEMPSGSRPVEQEEVRLSLQVSLQELQEARAQALKKKKPAKEKK